MSLNRTVLILIRTVTGRAVSINDKVSGCTFLAYLGRKCFGLARGLFVQLISARRPKWLFLDSGARIRGLGLLDFGTRLRLGERSRLICWSRAGIVIGNDFSFGEDSFLSNGFNPFGEIGVVVIGSNVGIGGHSYICCPSSLSIGDNTITGQYLSIHPQNHVFTSPDVPVRLQGTTAQGVRIGEDCWIGAKVTILDGVTIGAGSIIAAGAVVTQSFPERSIIGGVPARVIGRR
jgi:acetyltransferase-like isoleucine patch superfamily enzyme